MKKHFFKGIALCLLLLFSTEFVFGSEEMTTKRVKLTFSNGDSLDLPHHQATHFGTLRNMLEDIPTDEITIPVHFGNKELCKELIALTDIPVNQINQIADKESLKTADVLTAARLLQLADYLHLLDSNDKSKTPIKLKEKKLQALSALFKSKLQDPTIAEEAVVRITEETVSSLQGLESIAVAQAATQAFLELTPPIRIASHIKGEIQAFSPDSKFILTLSDKSAHLWNSLTDQCLHTFNHDNHVLSAHFSPDGNCIVTASIDRTAKLWDAHIGKCLHTFNHNNWVSSAQFSPDGNHIVTASRDNTAKLWNTHTDQCLHTFNHDDWVNSAQFSPDGNCIVTASWDYTAKVWDAHTGQYLRTLNHNRLVSSAQFSPDGNSIATASYKNTAKLWNTHTGNRLRTFNHANSVNSAQFSPDGNYIVTASWDKTAKLWDTRTGQCLHIFNHTNTVQSAHFSPDGNYIVTASYDKTAKLWDTRTGQCLHIFNHTNTVQSAHFSPDGNCIAVESSLYLIFTDCSTTLSPLQAWHLMQLLKIEHHETQKIYIKENETFFKNFDDTTKEKLKICELEIDKIIRWRK